MKRSGSNQSAKSAIDLLEEAIALLRSAPGAAFVTYYLGAVPFWLGLLYFVADMSHSAFASSRITGASLGVAVLFIWMKCWHAIFCASLRRTLLLEAPVPWSLSRAWRLVVQQAGIQPWGAVLRPIAFLATVPFIWVSAFFQNVSVLGATGEAADKPLVARSWKQAQLWPGQAHVITGLLLVFGFFVWLNVLSAVFVGPFLLRTLFGIETEASRSMGSLMNSTVLTATFALAMMCLDPIFKAVYVLRCFYGESLRSGQDLRVQLRRAQRNLTAVLGFVLALGFCQPSASSGAEPPPTGVRPPTTNVDANELSRSIDQVLQRRDYAWRSPRKEGAAASDDQSWFGAIGKWFVGKWQQARKLAEQFWDWVWKRKKTDEAPSGGFGSLPLQEMAFALVGLALALIAFITWRRLKQSRAEVLTAEPLPALPDLHDEGVLADQLPEDGWLDLMRKALTEGQRRIALRAAYLAGLAHLGHRELLTIARHKSNREYDRELRRRARSREKLLAAFRENLEAFERAWYGNHEVTDATLERFTTNLEVIRAC